MKRFSTTCTCQKPGHLSSLVLWKERAASWKLLSDLHTMPQYLWTHTQPPMRHTPPIHTIKLNYKWTNTLMNQMYRETRQLCSTSWPLLFLLLIPPLSSTSRCRHRVCKASVSRGLGKEVIKRKKPLEGTQARFWAVYMQFLSHKHTKALQTWTNGSKPRVANTWNTARQTQLSSPTGWVSAHRWLVTVGGLT